MAIGDFTKAIQLGLSTDVPGYSTKPLANAYYIRGLIYDHELGQYQTAIADYDKAIQLDPENAEVYQKRGYAYNKLGQGRAAVAQLAWDWRGLAQEMLVIKWLNF